jgi:hypothetical protein
MFRELFQTAPVGEKRGAQKSVPPLCVRPDFFLTARAVRGNFFTAGT